MSDIPTEQADKVIVSVLEAMQREGITGNLFPMRISDKKTSGFLVVFTGEDGDDQSQTTPD